MVLVTETCQTRDFFMAVQKKQPTMQTKNIQKLYLRILGKHDTMLVPGKVQYLYFVDMIKHHCRIMSVGTHLCEAL